MSEIRALVVETYRNTIKTGDYPPDLKKFLQTHERKIVFFENIVKEFNNPKLVKTLTREKVISVTRDMTHIFVMAAKRRADELNMSAIEKGLLKQKEDRAKEMRKLGAALDAAETEKVTHDKAGNEITQTQATIDESFK